MTMTHAGYLTIPKAAKMLGITQPTLRYWIRTGRVKAHQQFEQGHLYIPESEIKRLREQFNQPITTGGNNA